MKERKEVKSPTWDRRRRERGGYYGQKGELNRWGRGREVIHSPSREELSVSIGNSVIISVKGSVSEQIKTKGEQKSSLKLSQIAHRAPSAQVWPGGGYSAQILKAQSQAAASIFQIREYSSWGGKD